MSTSSPASPSARLGINERLTWGHIGFVGAGGVGKTVQAKMLAEKLNLPYYESVSRSVMREMNLRQEADQDGMPLKLRAELQSRITAAKRQQDRESPVGVFDRTPLDQFGYRIIRSGEAYSPYDMDAHVKQLRQDLTQYTVIFYIPWVLNRHVQAYDDFRVIGAGYQMMVDLVMRGLWLKYWPRLGISINPGSPESMHEQIISYLKFGIAF